MKSYTTSSNNSYNAKKNNPFIEVIVILFL